jgi:hypothetical protein
MPLAPSPFVRVAAVVVAAVTVACARPAVKTGSPPPTTQPLASYLSMRLVVTPTTRVRVDTMGMVQRLGGARAAARQLDSSISQMLSDRAIGRDWYLPPALVRAYELNRSYAADPYNLATDLLRSPQFVALSTYSEPLATQLRTMIALAPESRYVLLPVELRFEPIAAGGVTAVLRGVIVDARAAEARWVGELRGDPATDPSRAIANVASRLGDHFIAP